MSFLRTLKLALLTIIDPRLKINFIDLELEDTELRATKLMRARRELRKEHRALTVAAKKAVSTRLKDSDEEEETPKTVKVRKTTTKRVRTKRTTAAPSDDTDEPITGKLTKNKVMQIIAKHTAPKPAAEPQRPPKAKKGDTESSFQSIRNYIAPELPEITDEDERKVCLLYTSDAADE